MELNLNCLVTVGTGFIGSHLMEFSLTTGQTVRAVDNLSIGSIKIVYLGINNPNFSFQRENISNRQAKSIHFDGDKKWTIYLNY